MSNVLSSRDSRCFAPETSLLVPVLCRACQFRKVAISLGFLSVIITTWHPSEAQEDREAASAEASLASPFSQLSFDFERIGPAPFSRPRITNVQIVDLDGDGSQDVVVCDAQAQAVFCYRKSSSGVWEQQLLGDGLIAPAHATVVDLDQDGDLDVIVSVMGKLSPSDDVIGSLVLLENREGNFEKKILLDDVRRVVDAQPGDFDQDGDLDLVVAVFGYLRGQVLWLENRGDGNFRDHELLSAPGTIHVTVADFDDDGDLDIAAIVSQDEEEVWGFENVGSGEFVSHRLWMTVNFDLGSAGLVECDLDGDGDSDLLLPVGDNLEDSYSIPQPYHGCLWLENLGAWKFVEHRLASFPGTYAAGVCDLDTDGDQDVVLCSMVNDWDAPDSASVIWLENDGLQNFQQHTIAREPIMLTTVACGDLNNDSRPDIVAGGLRMFRPYDRLGRVSSWITRTQTEGAPEETLHVDDDRQAPAAPTSTPLPDLELIDAITRADLRKVYDRVAIKVAADQDKAQDWLTLGKAYYAYGYFSAANRCFEFATLRDEKSQMGNYLYGVSLSRLGRMSDAIEHFHKTLPIASKSQQTLIWHEIGRCQLRLENSQEAEEAFIRAGNYYASLAQLVKLRLRSGRAQEAVAPLEVLAQRQPGTTEVFLLINRVASALGETDKAQLYRDRAEYNAKKMPLDLFADMVSQDVKKYGTAKIDKRVKELIEKENWNEASTILQAVVDAQPNRAAIVLLAGVELQGGRSSRAIELVEKLIKNRGSYPLAMILLGDAYLAAGRADEAQQIWEATAQVRSVPELHKRLAELYEQVGDKDAARTQRALIFQSKGISALRGANPMLAKKILQQAVEFEPTLVDSWFYLAECRRLLGELSAARDAYQSTLDLEPNHGRAITSLELISK